MARFYGASLGNDGRLDGLACPRAIALTCSPVLAVLASAAATDIRSLLVAEAQKCRKDLLAVVPCCLPSRSRLGDANSLVPGDLLDGRRVLSCNYRRQSASCGCTLGATGTWHGVGTQY
jgi:hypothetical protein